MAECFPLNGAMTAFSLAPGRNNASKWNVSFLLFMLNSYYSYSQILKSGWLEVKGVRYIARSECSTQIYRQAVTTMVIL